MLWHKYSNTESINREAPGSDAAPAPQQTPLPEHAALGEAVRHLRLEAEMSQEELAEAPAPT